MAIQDDYIEAYLIPSETDGNPHPKLPPRLAHFGPVGGRASISQIASASSVLQLGLLHMWPLQYWLKPSVQFLHTLGITDAFVFLCGSVVEHCVSSAKGCGFDSQGTHILTKMYNLKCNCKIKASAKCKCKVCQACVAALAPWKNHQWMERGVPLSMVCRRKVVTTEVSNLGWGALCDGKTGHRPLVKE